MFATQDMPADRPLLIDVPVFAATDDRKREGITVCHDCCGTLLPETTPLTVSCCSIKFCHGKCRAHALQYHHRTPCAQNFDWVWEDSLINTENGKGDGGAGDVYQLDGPLWLRVLAVCVQSGLHPLDHPLSARLAPLNHGGLQRRWSLGKDIIMPVEILRQLGVDVFADKRFDTWVLQTVWARLANNVGGYSEQGVSLISSSLPPLFPFPPFLSRRPSLPPYPATAPQVKTSPSNHTNTTSFPRSPPNKTATSARSTPSTPS